MASFLSELILRITKGAPISNADYDNNPTKIAQQIDKFKVLDTVIAPTAPNVPVGELGNAIFSGLDMYRHDGTQWKRFNGQNVPLPATFEFLSFSYNGNDNRLEWSVQEELSADVAQYDIMDIGTQSVIGSVSYDGNLGGSYNSGQISLVLGNTYQIIAISGALATIKTTADDGFADVKAE